MKFWGKVRSHKKRGKDLGFPTANVNLSKKNPEGVYISKVKTDGKIYKALTFIGASTTFNETHFKSETYILDFEKDIYNQWISVTLLKKIRENQKFESSEKLVEQMKKDEKTARRYFSKVPMSDNNRNVTPLCSIR